MFRNGRALAMATAALLSFPPIVHGQAARSGPTFSLGGLTVPVIYPDVAHDSVNNRYLQVAGNGFIEAHLMNAAGSLLGTFRVNQSTNYAQAPRVAFSPDVAGGGGYLVTWHESVGPIAVVRGRIFNANGNAVSGDFDIYTHQLLAGLGSNWTMGAAVEYATGSHEFLVAWQGGYGVANDIVVQRVNNTGQLLGQNVVISAGTGDWEREPSIAYNPHTDEFYVAFAGFWDRGAGSYGYAGGRRVKAGTGAIIGGIQEFGASGATYMAAVTYNTATRQYLFGWYNQVARQVYGVVLNGTDAAQVGGVRVLSAFYGAYDALDIDYNPASGQSLLVTHGASPKNWEDAAVTILADGNAHDNGFFLTETTDVRGLKPQPDRNDGNYHPRVAASTSDKKWLAVTSSIFAATHAQFASTDGSAGGGSGGGGGGSAGGGSGGGGGTTRSAAAAKADFSGDGKPDILWQRNDGYLSLWSMDGATLTNATLLNPGRVADTNWRVVGNGDLNGDGKPEIVWQHMTSGQLALWFMNGANLQQDVSLDPPQILSNDWRISAVADMNRDGRADLIWQHVTDGWLAVWYMNGAHRMSDALLTPNRIAGSAWRIVGAGDVNGDGWCDLVWQHSTGFLSVWYMRQDEMLDAVYLNPGSVAGNAWRIVGVVDISADGKPDILWQHTDGWVATWLMDGINMTHSILLSEPWVNTAWRMIGQ